MKRKFSKLTEPEQAKVEADYHRMKPEELDAVMSKTKSRSPDAIRLSSPPLEMRSTPDAMSPGKKAQHTARWARIMTKWLVTYSRRTGAKWNLVEFGGTTRAESRGIVDMIAIRKDHHHDGPAFRRGDCFEIVLIQTKGGSAPRATLDDVARLSRVAKHHRVKAVILAEWRRGQKLELYKLNGAHWRSVSPDEIFG